MRKSLAAFLPAALVISLASLAKGDIIPPIGLAPGSPYQLIFVTADATVGSYGTEAPYNTFVNAEAALNPLLPSSTWYAVTGTADSTSTTDASNAYVNAPNLLVDGSYLPVYNTQGILVSSNASGGLYSGSILQPVAYDQYGNSSGGVFVWTGSNKTGEAFSEISLGHSTVELGASNLAGSLWMDHAFGNSVTSTQSLYALSSVLVSTPEPSTLVLARLGIAGLLLAARRRGA